MPYELYLALRYLRFHRGRTFLSIITLISVAGVTVGTAALVIALSLMAGFVSDVRERIHSGSAHLTVMSPSDESFAGGEALMRRLEETPGVHAVGPVLSTPALVSVDGGGEAAFAEVQGVSPRAHAAVLPPGPGSDRPFERLATPGVGERAPILLGEGLAERLRVVAGERVRVLVPELTLAPWGALPRSQVFVVAGTYRSSHFQEDEQRAYIDLDAARRLLRAPGRTGWVDVRLDDLGRLSAMKERLRGELSPDWIVVDLLEANRDLLKAVNMERLLLFLAIGLIVVVASLNIVSTLLLMVADKIKEIGTLTALGARSSGIATVFVLQGGLIGIVGTALGVSLGWLVAWWLDTYEVIRVNPEVYYLDHVPFTVQPLDLVFVTLLALGISFLATLYPSLKAALLDPVEALRHE